MTMEVDAGHAHKVSSLGLICNHITLDSYIYKTLYSIFKTLGGAMSDSFNSSHIPA